MFNFSYIKILLQVWKTFLSEDERNFLMHFLPTGSEPHQVVQKLLSGDNFHFGNPYLKWQDLFLDILSFSF